MMSNESDFFDFKYDLFYRETYCSVNIIKYRNIQLEVNIYGR